MQGLKIGDTIAATESYTEERTLVGKILAEDSLGNWFIQTKDSKGTRIVKVAKRDCCLFRNGD